MGGSMGPLTAFLILGCLARGTSETAQAQTVRYDVGETWVTVTTGADESLQVVRVRIWGTLRDTSFFGFRESQLDDDPVSELVIWSRNQGSGPYYRLQLIDVRSNGVAVWAYDSYGKPRIEGATVHLGTAPPGGAGASSPVYQPYRLGVDGLSRAGQ